MSLTSGGSRMGLGRGAQAPQFCGHPKFFCKGNNLFVFANFRKMGKFAASIERPKTNFDTVEVSFVTVIDFTLVAFTL